MITLQDIEQFIPFIKPLFDGLRSAKDFVHGARHKPPEHAIDIPKKTLIIMPESRTNALWWGMGTAASKPAMQIVGDFQATNTSPYAIRVSAVHLMRPRHVEVLMSMVTVGDAQTGMHSAKNLIPQRSIGEFRMMLFIAPPVCSEGELLSADISFSDQFDNEHIVKNLRFRHIGPTKQP